MLIDTHAHLCDEKFFQDSEYIAEKVQFCEPRIIIDTGTDRATSENCFLRAKSKAGIYCAVGVHPECANQLCDEDLVRFAEMWECDKTVAIGEIGLDYHYENNPSKEIQLNALELQIDLAYQLHAPIVFHVRDAHGDMVRILNDNKQKLKNGILLHCYSGSKELLKEYAKYDCYFSFGGVVTFNNATEKPEIIKSMPVDKLLLETDCPYMSPLPMRGKRNEPTYIIYTAKKVAEILGKSLEEIGEITTQNAKRLFKRIK